MISRAQAAANNVDFLKTYNEDVAEASLPLLNGHLMTRLEAIIVLAQTGYPNAVEGFHRPVDRPEADGLGQALGRAGPDEHRSDAHQQHRGLDPWPVGRDQGRQGAGRVAGEWTRPSLAGAVSGVEALGAMRLAADPTAQDKVEMAQATARYLTDPDVRVDVRAEAAWALG